VIGVFVSFDYAGELDRDRVLTIAENARSTFEGMPGLRSKVFTIDEERQRATNVYLWEDEAAARRFFSDELRERVTGLYGVAPRIEFVEIATFVDNAAATAAS
jgi:heme-degrading monooxygenase HmoA